MVVTNTSTDESVSGKVRFFDADGNRLDPASFLANGGSSFELPPLGSQTFATKGISEQLVQGSVEVKADGPVSAVVRFDLSGIGVAGVGAAQPARAIVAPARIAGSLNTGVAIRNVGLEQITVDLTLKDERGDVVAEGTRTIAGKGRIAQFIDELFPGAAGDGFKGSICVRARALAGRVAVVALELDVRERKFTTLPVSPTN